MAEQAKKFAKDAEETVKARIAQTNADAAQADADNKVVQDRKTIEGSKVDAFKGEISAKGKDYAP